MTSGTDHWPTGKTALDRVWSVGVTLSRPRDTAWIAEEAAVSERTARRHLSRLVEIGVLEEVSGKSSVLYRPDPLYTRLRGLRDLLDEHDDLEELRSNLEEQIGSWQSGYGVESPESLRKMAEKTDAADQTRELRWATNNWETIQHRMGLVDEAVELRDLGTV